MRWFNVKIFINEAALTLSLSIVLWVASLFFIYVFCKHFIF